MVSYLVGLFFAASFGYPVLNWFIYGSSFLFQNYLQKDHWVEIIVYVVLMLTCRYARHYFHRFHEYVWKLRDFLDCHEMSYNVHLNLGLLG
jgi:hypothetical protein